MNSKYVFKQTAAFIILSILFFGPAYGQIPATINAAGTWSASSGQGSVTFAAGSCYSVTVEAWGGGGGGGGAHGNGASGGGAGGGFAEGVVTISGGGACFYSVGAGGGGGTTAGTNGSNGGPTWFNGTAGTNNNTRGNFINAGGGAGGNGATTNTGAAAQNGAGTGTFGTPGVTATVSFSGGTGGGGFVNGGGDGGGGGGGAGTGGNGGNGATTITGQGGICPNGGGGGGGGGGGATGAGSNGNPGNSSGGGGTGGAANGGGTGGSGSASANASAGGAGNAPGGGGGAGSGCCGCNGGAGGNGAAGSGSIGGGGGGGTGDGGPGTGGTGGAHGGGGGGSDGGSTANGGAGGSGYLNIIVAIAPPPTATAGPALAAICQGGTSAIMNGSVTAGATAVWSGGAGTWTNATDPVNATYTAGATETGTITLTLTATSTCGTGTATTTITINPAPAALAVTSPVTYCQNATAVALTATGTNLLWYTAATGGTGSGAAPIPSTTTAGSTTYYVSQTLNGCESARNSIVVTVNAGPAATAGNTGPYCANVTITLNATGGGTYSWSGPNGYTGTGASPTPFSTDLYGPGTYTVTVTSAGNCSATASTNVAVSTVTPPPTVTSPLAYCENATAIPLTANGSNLLWYAAVTGGTGSSTAPTPPTTTVGQSTYYLSQTLNNCESARDSIVVIVNALPVASAGNTGPYCPGDNITLSATGGNTYSWSGPNSYSGTGASPAPFSAATYGGGAYTVTVTDANACTATASTNVAVSTTPEPTVTSPVAYCQNAAAAQLTATGTGLLWYTAATGGTGSNTAPAPSTTANGQTTYYVSQTVNGCESARDSIVVIVNAPPVASASNTGPYCTGENVLLSALGGSTYSWSGPNAYTGTGASPTPFSAAISGAGAYNVTVTDVNTCTATASTTVVINALSSSAISQTLCSDKSITFGGHTISTAGVYNDTLTSAVTGCDSIVTLTLTVIPVSSSSVNQSICTGAVYTFGGQALNTAGTYHDTLISAVTGCDSIVTLTLQVTAPFTASDSQTICSGDSVNFYGRNISVAGLYTDTLTTGTGCDSIIYFTLNVSPKAAASFFIQPTIDQIGMGTNVLVTNTSTNSNSEQWLLNSQAIALLAGGVLPVKDTGTYCVQLIAGNTGGCNDTSAQQCIYIFNNYTPVYIPNAFTPNGDGINDYMQVYANKAVINYLSIGIYDRWGEKVFESVDPGFMWNGTYKGKPLPAGVYVYEIDIALSSGQSFHKKGGISLLK